MNNSTWSISLGCWSGVHVRLHVTLALLMLCALLLCEKTGYYTRASFPVDRVVLIVLLGLASVAAHAASHVVTAARRGMETHELMLAPWGEWNWIGTPACEESPPAVHLVGVVTSLLLSFLAAIVLWLHGDTSISEMLVPLDSNLLLQETHPLVAIRWLFCVNYCLVLMNLIPAAPFDGGRLVKSLLRVGAPQLNDEALRQSVNIIGRLVGLLLIAVAVWLGQGDKQGLFPAWFPLTVLGLIALFAVETPAPPVAGPAEKTAAPDEEDLLDESADDSEISSSDAMEWEDGPFAQWLEEKRDLERARRQEAQQGELADERRVDEILARLHERGPQALSSEDRQVLQRVSDRLRRRKQKKT